MRESYTARMFTLMALTYSHSKVRDWDLVSIDWVIEVRTPVIWANEMTNQLMPTKIVILPSDHHINKQ
jgi:hypothetical protein